MPCRMVEGPLVLRPGDFGARKASAGRARVHLEWGKGPCHLRSSAAPPSSASKKDEAAPLAATTQQNLRDDGAGCCGLLAAYRGATGRTVTPLPFLVSPVSLIAGG